MSQDVNLSINGQSRVPPGFRFHPTEEELLHYYLRKKIACENIDLDIIREVDLNKLEPWDIQEKCRIGSAPQNDWYFFCHKDRKYPTGTRTNRATTVGFWKATGRDKIIRSRAQGIGLRKTLVFYKGRAPHGQKSDWILHEYRLDDISISNNEITAEAMPEEGWVICRIFKKKSYVKTLDSLEIQSGSSGEEKLHVLGDGNIVVLDKNISHIGTTSKSENDSLDKLNMVSSIANSNELLYSNGNPSGEILSSRFMHLPSFDSPLCPNDSNLKLTCYPYQPFDEVFPRPDESPFSADQHGMIGDWATLDRLVASQLDSQAGDNPSMSIGLKPHNDEEMPFSSRTRLTTVEYHHDHDRHQDSDKIDYRGIYHDHDRHQDSFLNDHENVLWGFAKSTSQPSSSLDPLRYLLA